MEQLLRDKYYIKLVMMAIFIAGDLFVNSKSEYEALQVDEPTDTSQQLLFPPSNRSTAYEEMSQLQIILLGCSILLQASIFSAFFLILADTFPFQVGLLGVVGAQFKHMPIAQGLYSLMTISVGAMRLDQVFKGNTDIWSNAFYIIMSFFHKLGAPCYYAVSLRSAMRLGNEMYYTKEAWTSSGETISDAEAQK
ncbi:hypothetical protein ACHAWO_009386 [Cyclotella atomus]|uniref:Transmembrane protein 138 n=1 Tax=Cyclotella atomus TaxID=382360 RepID=A0ABD3N3Q2_9STRA